MKNDNLAQVAGDVDVLLNNDILAQVAGDVNVLLKIDNDSSLYHSYHQLLYPSTVHGTIADDARAVIFPRGAMQVTMVVDAASNTHILNAEQGKIQIPRLARGSEPSFRLDGIFGQKCVVHALFFRPRTLSGDMSAFSIIMSIFDITQCGDNEMRSMDPDQRFRRLHYIFGTAWYKLQHDAMASLCTALWNSGDPAKQSLSAKLLSVQCERDSEKTWTPEFLDQFAQNQWKEWGDYNKLLCNVPEMDRVRFPIPRHIQLCPVFSGRECHTFHDKEELGLPGDPEFGGILQLPEHLQEGANATLWTPPRSDP